MENREVIEAVLAEAVPLTLYRDSAGSYSDDGRWITGNVIPTTIRATIQPAEGRKLQELPEGLRNEAQFFLWTNSAVEADDNVDYEGKRYRILDAWPRPEGGFTKAVIGRVSDDR